MCRFPTIAWIAVLTATTLNVAVPHAQAQSPWSPAPSYQVRYYGAAEYQAPRTSRDYNPVGFGFGGYSYGSYPAYGYNGYLPAAYAGFNTVESPVGGYSYYRASDQWGAACGPNGCRLNYQGW